MRVDLCGWRFELCSVGLIMLNPAIALAIIGDEKMELFAITWILDSYLCTKKEDRIREPFLSTLVDDTSL